MHQVHQFVGDARLGSRELLRRDALPQWSLEQVDDRLRDAEFQLGTTALEEQRLRVEHRIVQQTGLHEVRGGDAEPFVGGPHVAVVQERDANRVGFAEAIDEQLVDRSAHGGRIDGVGRGRVGDATLLQFGVQPRHRVVVNLGDRTAARREQRQPAGRHATPAGPRRTQTSRHRCAPAAGRPRSASPAGGRGAASACGEAA